MPFSSAGWVGFLTLPITNTGSAVTDWQQVVYFTSADLDFSLFRSDGLDVRFVTSDGVTELPHWRRVWDSTNEIAELWVKCDLAAAGVTNLRLYYGNASAPETSSYDSTMQKLDTDGSTALALYHFDESSGTPVDSTGITTATLIGSPTRVGSDLEGWGPLESQNFASGNALDCSGGSQAIKFSSLLNSFSSAYCIELTIQWPSAIPSAYDPRLAMKYHISGGGATYNGLDLYVKVSTDRLVFRTVSGGTINDITSVTGDGIGAFEVGKRYRIVIQQSSTHGKELWVNGSLEAKDASATTIPTATGTASSFVLGAYDESSSPSNFANIQIDEFRVLSRWQSRDEIVANWTRRKYFSGVSTQASRLTLSSGNPLLGGSGGSNWDADSAQEPVPYFDGTDWNLWYTGYKNSAGVVAIGLATASTAEGTYSRSGSNPLIGLTYGGVAGNAAHPGVYYESGTYTMMYSDEITATANLRRAVSTDKVTWTGNTIAISKSAQAGITGWANPKIVKDGSTYHLMVEGWKTSGARWVVSHATNTSISADGSWSFSSPVPVNTMEFFPGRAFSHASVVKVGSKWHAWYHTSTSGTNLPSVVVHAVSADLVQWLPDLAGGIVLGLVADGITLSGQRVDQIADPTMVEAGGNSYLFYDRSTNTPNLYADLRLATYAGTVAQFVVDNPSVGALVSAGSALLSTGYTIQSAGSATLGTGYSIHDAGSATLGAGYSIQSAGSATLGAGYSIHSAGSGTLGLGYSIHSSGSATLAAGYEIEAAAGTGASTLGVGYSVHSAGSATLGTGYSVRSSGLSDLPVGYAINSAGNAVLAAGYGIDGGGFATLSLGYRIESAAGTGATAEEIVAALMATEVETGVTVQTALRVLLAAVSGPTSGLGTSTERYFDPAGLIARITANFDGNSNRTSVTLDGS